MTSVLLVDDCAVVVELFARAIREHLGYFVDTLSRPCEVTDEFVESHRIDAAVVDLSYGSSSETGVNALLTLHLHKPATRLIVLARGPGWSNELIRDAWEALPLASAIAKDSSVQNQLDTISRVVVHGFAPPDPLLRLPSTKSPWRTLAGFARLVQHRGHAKLWATVLACGPNASYSDLVEHSGLRLNALRNYRAQLLPELALHGLRNPPMRDLYEFAHRSRPFLSTYVQAKGISFAT